MPFPLAATVQALLGRGTTYLAARSDSAALDAQLLLSQALQRPRSYLLSHAEDAVDATAAAHYRRLLERRAAGEPLAYVLGQREFWSLTLSVDAAVLIPRPETELAVERCLALVGAGNAEVIDLGTGSGAIALALAHERPRWRITATDLSSAALDVARANAERLQLRLRFVRSDWLAGLAGQRFDLIVSNPPYIGAADSHLQALRYEPAAALTPGRSGLEALQQIVAAAPDHLHRGGFLVLEHGFDQAEALRAELVAAGYARVRCHRDLAGQERVTEAQWPGT